jgi:hypothetical protein
MTPLLQLNLADLVFRPPGTGDIRFLTLFLDAEKYPQDGTHGTTWELRTYSSLAKLVPLHSPAIKFELKPMQLGPPALVEDFPCFEDLEKEVDDDVWDRFREQHPTLEGIKLGGWPSLVQSEISWAPFGRHPAQPEYVLQVDSPEVGWQWGPGGCAYIGRGTSKGHRKEWFLEWQCL